MVKVCFKNTLDEIKEFEEIEAIGLIKAVHEYARTKDSNIYQAIMQQKVNVYLNGKFLEVDDWLTELSDNDEVIITPAIEDGNAGIFQTIFGTLLTIAGFVIPGAQFLIPVGIGLGLGGISNLLFKPDLPVLPSYNNSTSTQTYNWSGISTTAQQDSPIPIVFGTHAVGGNIISLYTQSINNYNYLYMLLGLSEGEIEGICQEKDYTQICTTSDSSDAAYITPAITLNGQPIRNFDEVEWWYRTGTNLPDSTKDQYYPFVQNMIPYFASSIIQYNDGRALVSTDWVTYTTTKKVDILTILLEAPQLYQIDETTGDVNEYYFTYKMQWKKVSDSTWNDLSLTQYVPAISSTNANTAYCTVSYLAGEYIWGIKSGTYIIKVINKQSSTGTSSNNSPYSTTSTIVNTLTIEVRNSNNNLIETKDLQGFTTINVQVNPSTGQEITSEASVDPTFTLESYNIKFDYSNLEIGAQYTIYSESQGSASEFKVVGKSQTGIFESKSIDFNAISTGPDYYEIRIERTDVLSSSFTIQNAVNIDSVTEIVQGKFIYPNTALLGIKIKANYQLSGSPPTVVTTLKGLKVEVPDLEDASPSGTDVTFEDCFWNDDTSTWEKYDGTEVYWNNTNSWRTEYTENFICQARNLLINQRYGVGAYLTESNINKLDIITGVKECHKEYYPSDDYVAWWNSGKDSSWEDNWRILGSRPAISEYNITSNDSARTIDIPGTASITYSPFLVLQIDLTRPFIRGQKYTISLSLSSIGATITSTEVRGISNSELWSDIDTLGTFPSTGTDISGTYDLTVTASRSYTKLEFYFTSVFHIGIFNGGRVAMNFEIDDISIAKGSAPISTTQNVDISGGKEHFHTWNGVLETDKSALTALVDMCMACRCWPTWYNETFGFIIDRDSTPVHTLTKGNTKSFKQNFTPISQIPYRLIGQYTDESVNFDMKSVVVQSSATNVNKTNEQTIGLKGLTDFNRVARELKWKMDTIENCNQLIEIEADVDAVHCTAGDIFYFQDDLPQWGQGGRILDYTATNITLDQKYTFTNVATDTHIVRFQDNSNNFNVATVNHTHVSNNASLQVIPIDNLIASPCSDSVYVIGVPSQDLKKFRAFVVERTEENSVNITAREHISNLYTNPDFVVAEVSKSTLPNILSKPPALKKVSITQLSVFEGKGFNIGVTLDIKDTLTKEIVVQICKTGTTNFETLLVFPINQRQAKYVDNSLKYDTDYIFKVFGRSQYEEGPATFVTTKLNKMVYAAIPSPSGLSTKDSNNNYFYGKDVTLVWNAVGSSSTLSLDVLGYKIDVYHTNVQDSNILRTAYVSNTSYTYTLEMNEDDCSRLGLSQARYSSLIFTVHTVAQDNLLSSTYSVLETSNSTPATLTGLESESDVGGVRFSWIKSTELDHKRYSYRTLIGSGSWGNWKSTDNSMITKALTTSDITNYGSRATIHFEVKDVDWYEQESNIASVVASANEISDSIYQALFSSNGSYTGNLASLLDGDINSGGIIIT